ncbi:MAG: carbamoyltransferase [Planctomycetes bacterium]|nr:carbamoyltransferase [Planctomycetota bacterium]
MTAILGVNAYHGDAAACIVVDGTLIAAAEEERFRRIKHWAGVPTQAIRYCLREAGVEWKDVRVIASNRDPKANLLRKAIFTLSRRPGFDLVRDRLKNALRVRDLKSALETELGPAAADITRVEHHRAHLASAFFVSPFDDAALLSVDGFGDFVSTMTAEGRGADNRVFDKVAFPHSLGLFYTAVTQYLGFPKYGDEYKVMGLAPYGEPTHLRQMEDIAQLGPGGTFRLNLDYFLHHSEGVAMTWDGGEPAMGRAFSDKFAETFGPVRRPDEPLEDRHRDLAASLQAMYEKAFFHLLNHLHERTRNPRLCLAGGCAMNSVANGKIFDHTPFRDVYIQPAAGDAGGALGAAYDAHHRLLGQPRGFVMKHAYWGPQFSTEEIEKTLQGSPGPYRHELIENTPALVRKTAEAIRDGKVVGWFQGRMEWGPRALGNRSIVVDPRRADMKDVLNARIKRREPFRPFAPSILLERTGEYFETSYPDPFMIKVYKVRPEKRATIPAVTHVDGSGRLQTVSREENPLYWELIREFDRLTGVPVILNTSFNENEPIVCTPREALECFLRTKMDVLVAGDFFLSKDARNA